MPKAAAKKPQPQQAQGKADPKAQQKPAPIPKPSPAPEVNEAVDQGGKEVKAREVAYPHLDMSWSWIDDGTPERKGGLGPITVTTAIDLLDLRTETERTDDAMEEAKEAGAFAGWDEAQIAAHRKTIILPEEPTFRFQGERVWCFNGYDNRSIDLDRSRGYAQDVLNRKWKLNGEAIILGRTGKVISANHRLIGLFIAYWEWSQGPNKDHWQKVWPPRPLTKNGTWTDAWDGGPFLESFVTMGVSEDPETVTTVDNTKPRSEADVIETSGTFLLDGDGRQNTKSDRRLCSQMMASAVEWLWRRTRAGKTGVFVGEKMFRTRSEEMDFINRHPHLAECVRHIFTVNKVLRENVKDENGKTVERVLGRKISDLFSSPGRVAAAMYLMACRESDAGHENGYWNLEVRDEEFLNFSTWDLAKRFWADVGKGEGNALVKFLREVRCPVTSGDTPDQEFPGGKVFPKPPVAPPAGVDDAVRFAAIAQAWDVYLANGGDVHRCDKEDFQLEFNGHGYDPEEGTLMGWDLLDPPDFKGIDMGELEKPKPGKGKKEGGDGGPEQGGESDQDTLGDIDEDGDDLDSGESEELVEIRDEEGPTPEEIETEKARIKAENLAQMRGDKPKKNGDKTGTVPTGPKKAGQPISRKTGNG